MRWGRLDVVGQRNLRAPHKRRERFILTLMDNLEDILTALTPTRFCGARRSR